MVIRPLPTLFALAGLVAHVANALPTVSRQGKQLVTPDGTRFLIKGIAYQPAGAVAADSTENAANGGFPEPSSYVDPLSNLANCQRDLPNLQTLGINTIRVYSINYNNNHADCMNLFNDAGIYVIADLSLPLNGSINRAAPSWDVSLLNEYTQTLDTLAQYPNLLAVNIGNEVVSGPQNSGAAPFVKAAARDIKAYIKSKKYTTLVGYAAVDGDDWRNDLAAYLNCGSDDISIDLYGLNNYRWCGQSTYQASYASVVAAYQNLLNIPAYFSEYGCVDSGTRDWQEVASIFANPMLQTFSGGVAFEYFADAQGFGMTANLTSPNATTITTNTDFANLATAYNAVPNTTTASNAAQGAYPTCPTTATADLMATSALPPTPNAQACACFVQNAFSCTVKPNTLPTVLGSLLDYTCNALGQGGANCNAIGANGTTGTYGQFSYCSPEQKLDAAFTAYYTLQKNNANACDFSGNATVNSAINAQNAPAAVQQCQQGVQPTFTPSGVSAANPSATATAASRTGANAAAQATPSKAGAASVRSGLTAAAGVLMAAGLAVVA